MTEAAEAGAVPQQQQSFTERKAAQLREEREARGEVEPQPIPQQDPAGTPSEAMGSTEDVEQDEAQGLYADDVTDAPEDDESVDPEGTPTDDDPEETGEGTDWEKRYKDLQRETQAVRESRGEMEKEHAESMGEHLKLRFEMEDKLTEAVSRAELMRNVMSGNAQQFRNINWSQVPPERIQEVQAQAQQALQMEQQADAAYQQMQEQVNETRNVVKQREAEIAKVRLKRTIPGWSNEVYSELRQSAVESGMPATEFNEITSPVIIEALYAAMQNRRAGSTVQKVRTNRKAAAPRGKAARRAPRDERGRYAAAKVEPNVRGSFADKHRHRLAMERNGR
jgi:hypothetical protein